MAILNRNSVLAVVVESTEGTPVAPSAAGEYIALQDDAAMDPAFDVLTNAELKASIGQAKPILGAENPTMSFSHYLRHSGTEGDAPNYGELLQAAFGAEDDAGVEHNTVASSTTSVIKVDTGEGATYIRGQALLIKDATNGYSIRPVHSISSDDLTIGFNVGTAPGTGVDLGEAITYYPANTGHQTLSLWHYLGNSGAVQMMAGSRVTNVSMTFPAGELINASYTCEGIEYYFNPIEIVSTDQYIDWTDDAGTFAATVALDFYKDPDELASALATAMNAATTETIEVTYSDTTGKFTIASSTSSVLSLLWNTGTNTANTIGDAIGFSVAADDTGATSYEADSAIDYSSPQTPSFDSADPLAAKDNEVLIGDADSTVCFKASTVDVSIDTPKTNIESICAASGISGSIINSRAVTVTVTALLEQYDVDKFNRFHNNTETRFLYNFGTKSGGNWEAGKCGCLYIPTATITSYNISNEDGLVALNLELTAFVDSDGNGEVYLSFV